MDKVYDYLMSEANIKYGDAIVVGVSGGPDSMALLHLLSKIKKALDIELICAHVNHNVRSESKNEEEFVKRFCRNHSIVFETIKIEDYGDDNFHNEARSKRYNYFANIVRKYHAKFLLTAHHADDLIETILMRIVRGSTLRGYSGFSKVVDMGDYVIIRPLINITKNEILTYNKNYKVSYVQDESNLKDIYTRNRFRKNIVPQFKKEEPKVHEKFYKFSKILLEYNKYIDMQVEKIIKKIYPQNTLNIEEFLKEENIIQMKIIYYMLEHIYQDDLMLITDRHAELLCNLVKSKKANASIHLPNNIKAIKAYNNLYLVEEQVKNSEYEIEIDDYVCLPNGKIIEVVDDLLENNNNICRLDSCEVKLPLHVRTRKQGDKISVKGMLGRKKVNDIFIDSKIPLDERDIWPIVIDSENNVIWVPGLKKSKFDRTRKENYDIILKYY